MALEAVGDRPDCILLLLENCWEDEGLFTPYFMTRRRVEREADHIQLLTKATLSALPHPPYWIAVPSGTPLVLISVHLLSLDVSVS